MVHFEPEEGIAEQKTLHLMPLIIKNITPPIGMQALAVISMLIEVRAIKEAQAVLVGGKMRRDPVEDHADIMLMQIINKIHKVSWCPVALRGGKVPGDLIAPGSVEGMLHHWQKLDMSKPHVVDIVGQRRSQLAISQRTIALFGHTHPG